MAEQHDETEASSGPEKPDSEAPAAEQIETEAADAEGEEPEPAATSVAQPKKKKKKKAALAAEDEPIRDRNQRLRAQAAGKRRARQDEQRGTRNLEAGEIVDDALARSSQAAGEWLKKNFNVLQWFILAGIVGWIGYAVYSYRAGRTAEKTSAQLTSAIRAEDARVGVEDTKQDPQSGLVDTRPVFATDAERLAAAEKQYRAIADASTSTPAATFAKLGLASVLYDEGKYADAKAAYQAVRDSKLAGTDMDVKGRALEGIGMSLEGAKDVDGAGKAFGELANLDGLGFGALGQYHQARLAVAANNPEKAKELLKDAQKKLDAASEADGKKALGAPTGYLQQSVKDLLKQVDPTAVTESPNALSADQMQELQDQMGSGDGKGMNNAKLQELLRQMSKNGPKAPIAPAPPASAP